MFEVIVGLKYIYSARKEGFMSFLAGVSVLGIALGVAALIVVLSVFNGLQRDLSKTWTAGDEHIWVTAPKLRVEHWENVQKTLLRTPGVVRAAPALTQPALLRVDGLLHRAVLQGVDPAHAPSGQFASLKPGAYGIELPVGLARILDVKEGDTLAVLTAAEDLTIAGAMPRYRQFTVTKLFDASNFGYGAFVHLRDAQALYQTGPTVTQITVTLAEPLQAARISQSLKAQYPQLSISDWTEPYQRFLQVLNTQRRVASLLLFLIVALAAFNLTASLMMAVSSRKAEVAILRTMGSTPASIRGIFLVVGGGIGAAGAALGAAVGIPVAWHIDGIVSWLEKVTGQSLLKGVASMSSSLPSEVHFLEVALICAAAILLALMATIYPSWKASRIAPADALK
jgi:lipoprotein-releasing system permease protein